MNIQTYNHTITHDFPIKELIPFNTDDLTGWNVDYIIAGGFVHDVVNGLTPSDIDIWVLTIQGYYELVEYFSSIYTNIKYHIHGIFIEIEADNLPYNIQLLNTIDRTPLDIIKNFDMDYIRCYFDGNTIQMTPDCLEAWNTEVIRNMVSYCKIRPCRILKSHQKGYKFERKLCKYLGMDITPCCNQISNIYCSTHTEYWKEPMYIDTQVLDGFNNDINAPGQDRRRIPITKSRIISLDTLEQCLLLIPLVIEHKILVNNNSINYDIDQYNYDLNEIYRLLHYCKLNQVNTELRYLPNIGIEYFNLKNNFESLQ
jgi:hypothetical protein